MDFFHNENPDTKKFCFCLCNQHIQFAYISHLFGTEISKKNILFAVKYLALEPLSLRILHCFFFSENFSIYATLTLNTSF